jgi:hypothetical protein
MPRLLETARDLAGAGHGKGLCLSVFLDLDPSTVPTTSALATHVQSVVDDARRRAEALPPSIDHDRRMALREDVERVAAYLEREFDRSDARGKGIYASGLDDVWREVRLPAEVDDSVTVRSTFTLAPLLESIELDRELLLVAVSRERGAIWRRTVDEAALVDDLTEEIQSQHDQGGWSQANYERSRDKDALDHMRSVADAVGSIIEPGSAMLLAIACPLEERATFEAMLAPHVRAALLGWAAVEAHDDGTALAIQAEALLADRLHDEQRALIERWREAAGRGRQAASGWEDVVASAWAGAVDTLLVDGATRDAWECPICGRGSMSPGACVVDGASLERSEHGALDLALHGTLLHGGDVRLVEDDSVSHVEGAAALLRFPAAAG